MNKCLDDLPDEIVIEILSYLSIEDLAFSVPRVSSRWKQLSQANTIWNNVVFTPEENMEDEKIIELLENLPALKSFSGTWLMKNIHTILKTISTSCNKLESLYLVQGSKVPYEVLEELTECLQIKYLSIPILSQSDSLKRAELIIKFQSLTGLKFSESHLKAPKYILQTITDGCPSLKHMDLGNNTFDDEDIRYFLQKTKKQLVSFKIWCPISVSTFNHITECVNLEKLLFYTYGHISCITYHDLLSLKNLHNLKELKMGYYKDKLSKAVPNLFEGRAMAGVMKLTLCYLKDFNETHLNQVIINCPQLVSLELDLPSLNLDEAFKNIGNCKNLRSLGIQESNNWTEKCLEYVAAGCSNLQDLTLSLSPQTPQNMLQSILKMKRLNKMATQYLGFGSSMDDLLARNPHQLVEMLHVKIK